MARICPDCGGRLDPDEVLGLVCVECERVVGEDGEATAEPQIPQMTQKGAEAKKPRGERREFFYPGQDAPEVMVLPAKKKIPEPEDPPGCPKCGGGLARTLYRREGETWKLVEVQCARCGLVPTPVSIQDMIDAMPPPKNFPCVIVPVLPESAESAKSAEGRAVRLILSGEEGGRQSAYFRTGDPVAGLGVVVSVQWFGKTTLEVASAARRVADQLGVELEEGT